MQQSYVCITVLTHQQAAEQSEASIHFLYMFNPVQGFMELVHPGFSEPEVQCTLDGLSVHHMASQRHTTIHTPT